MSFDEDPPLFWEVIPDNAEEHPDVQAILNLDSEGTTEEIAENRKYRGNKAFVAAQESEEELRRFVKPQVGKEEEFQDERAKLRTRIKLKLNEALESYTEAISQNISNQELNSVYFSNRAAVHLHMGKESRSFLF